jgi:5'-3' exoribonuclease 1
LVEKIAQKVSSDSLWKSFKVIFSGVEVPGEGEHKIIQYIRANRRKMPRPYRHCIYSPDADLVMLSLITHEPFVTILREPQQYGKQRDAPDRTFPQITGSKHPWIFFVNVLREYLKEEFKIIPDFERFIQDYVLICMLLGNDFVQKSPSIKGPTSLDQVFALYKRSFTDYIV